MFTGSVSIRVRTPNVDRTSKNIKNLKPILKKIRDDIKKQINKNFTTQSSDGRPWAQLSPTYSYQKRRAVGKKPILQRTGKMKRTIRSHITGNQVIVYSPMKYAVHHVYGTRRMPARNFLLISRKVRDKYRNQIRNYLLRGR